jgi:hypothetical protein
MQPGEGEMKLRNPQAADHRQSVDAGTLAVLGSLLLLLVAAVVMSTAMPWP